MMEWFATTILFLGVGTCDPGGDWCRRPVGTYGIEQSILEYDRHSVWFDGEHYSEAGDGEPTSGDYGVNIFTLRYKYQLR